MDILNLLMKKLNEFTARIKEIYAYIFRFFLPNEPEEEKGFALWK